MPNIPPAIPTQPPPRPDKTEPLAAGNEAPSRSPGQPDSMHRAEDDAEAREVSRDFGEQAPKPGQDQGFNAAGRGVLTGTAPGVAARYDRRHRRAQCSFMSS